MNFKRLNLSNIIIIHILFILNLSLNSCGAKGPPKPIIDESGTIISKYLISKNQLNQKKKSKNQNNQKKEKKKIK